MARYQAGLRTEARIVDATQELLGEVGLEGTTLKAICDRAGVRSGSFYNLFDSKEEVVLRVVRDAITAVDPDPEGIGNETVEELVHAYATFITAQPEVARIYLQVVVSGGLTDNDQAKRFLRHHESRVGRFADAIKRNNPRMTSDDASTQAELLLAALNGLAFHWSLQPSFDFLGHVERIVAAHVWLHRQA